MHLLKGIWGLFGRNQWALLAIHMIVIFSSMFAVALSQTATADMWLDFIWKYGLGAAASFSIPSGGIKFARELRRTPPSDLPV